MKGTVIARRDTGQVFYVGSGACAFAAKWTACERWMFKWSPKCAPESLFDILC